MKTTVNEMLQFKTAVPEAKNNRARKQPAFKTGSVQANSGNGEAQTFKRALQQHEDTQKQVSDFQVRNTSNHQKSTENETKQFQAPEKTMTENRSETPVKEENVEQLPKEENVEQLPKEEDVEQLPVVEEENPEEIEEDDPDASREGFAEFTNLGNLMQLIVDETALKLQQLKQYVSGMRENGKKADEILGSLKNLLTEMDNLTHDDLKGMKLLLANPKSGETLETELSELKTHLNSTDEMTDNRVLSLTKETEQAITKEIEKIIEKLLRLTEALELSKDEAAKIEDLAARMKDLLKADAEIQAKLKELVSLVEESGKVLKGFLEKNLSTLVNKEILQQVEVPEKLESELKKEILKFLENNISDLKGLYKTAENVSVKDTDSDTIESLKEKLTKLISETLEANLKETDVKRKGESEPQVNRESVEKILRFLSREPEIAKELLRHNEPLDLSKITADSQLNLETLQNALKMMEKGGETNKTGLLSLLKTKEVNVSTISKKFLENLKNGETAKRFFKNVGNVFIKKQSEFIKLDKMIVKFTRMRESSLAGNKNDSGKETRPMANQSGQQQRNAASAGKGFKQTRLFESSFEKTYTMNVDKRRSVRAGDINPKETKSKQVDESTAGEKKVVEKSKTGIKNSVRSTEETSLKSKEDTKGLKEASKSDATRKTVNNDKTGYDISDSKETRTGTANARLNKNVTPVEQNNMNQVYQKIKQISQMMKAQIRTVETAQLKLNPPELGKISLQVVKDAGKISIVMQVETKEAQEILQRNSGLLAARLSNAGFEPQKVQVQMEKYNEQGEQENPEDSKDDSSSQQEKENQNQRNQKDRQEDYDENTEYSFSELLKGGIEDAS